MSRQKLTLRIDRIVVDRPGLTREAVAAALQSELRTLLATGGPAALGPSRAVESLAGTVRGTAGQTAPSGAGTLASATVRALRS